MAALTLVALSALILVATEALPGDAANVIAGPNATDVQREQIRQELGLDRPLPQRYVEWIGGAVRGDLGDAYVGGAPVREIIERRLGNSLILAGLAAGVLIPLALLAGTIAGMRAGEGAERGISLTALVAFSVPEFVTGSVLIAVFAGAMGWFPPVVLLPFGGGPLDAPRSLVLPVLTLVIVAFGFATRIITASVADVTESPYVEAARLNGVTGWRLACFHVLPNALAPAMQAFGLVVGALVGAAVVTEGLFNYPGIGAALTTAVAARDIPLVQGISLTLAAIALGALVVADLLETTLTRHLRETR